MPLAVHRMLGNEGIQSLAALLSDEKRARPAGQNQSLRVSEDDGGSRRTKAAPAIRPCTRILRFITPLVKKCWRGKNVGELELNQARGAQG